jgi:hypothetical protein
VLPVLTPFVIVIRWLKPFSDLDYCFWGPWENVLFIEIADIVTFKHDHIIVPRKIRGTGCVHRARHARTGDVMQL